MPQCLLQRRARRKPKSGSAAAWNFRRRPLLQPGRALQSPSTTAGPPTTYSPNSAARVAGIEIHNPRPSRRPVPGASGKPGRCGRRLYRPNHCTSLQPNRQRAETCTFNLTGHATLSLPAVPIRTLRQILLVMMLRISKFARERRSYPSANVQSVDADRKPSVDLANHLLLSASLHYYSSHITINKWAKKNLSALAGGRVPDQQ